MRPRPRQTIRTLLKVAGASLLLLVASVLILIVCNCRDAPPPDLSGLETASVADVPANSNGWYCIREAVRDAWIPARTASLYAVWCGVRREDAAGLRELLASNTLALAWIDRAANSVRIAPPRVYLPEDGNWLGWSPVAKCGRTLRLRAELALVEGRTNDALRDYGQSLRLARLYLESPPVGEPDALAAFVEVRNVLHALRDASERLGVRVVWERFGGDLRALSDLREPRRRASAAALEADRRELARLGRMASGAEVPPVNLNSPFDSIFPDDATRAAAIWPERLAIGALNLLPVSYRLQPNRTLAIMAGVRRGGPLPASVLLAVDARRSSSWMKLLNPAWRLLGPNGLGEIYVIIQSERQNFIEGGARLAEGGARGTRLALALRLYEQEHGELPERLDALVPAWIEAVPADPYDGRLFRYHRARRLVYSIGPNRRDDDGGRDDVLFPIATQLATEACANAHAEGLAHHVFHARNSTMFRPSAAAP
jgi:hypothetical protein